MPSELHEFNLFDLTNMPFGDQKKKLKQKTLASHFNCTIQKFCHIAACRERRVRPQNGAQILKLSAQTQRDSLKVKC